MRPQVARKKDSYRPAFCDSQFYLNHLSHFKLIHQRVSHLPLIEQITIWVIACSCLRRPDSWYSGLQNIPSTQADPHSNHFFLQNLFTELKLAWPPKLSPQISIYEFCKTVRINPLPQAATRALYFFYVGHYPLEILCYEPRPLELLQFQIRGKRILTFNSNFQIWPTLKYGERDPLSFWLHDLIHAEHFFSDPINRQGQVGFYRFIQEILEHKILDSILLNADFNEAFSYLISDMNSHPIHLIKTFKALIDIHEKGLSTESLWQKVINLRSIENQPHIQIALNKVNKALFSTSDAVELTTFFNRTFHLDLERNHYLNTAQL